MEGLLLIAAYAAFASVGEALAMGIGLVLDQFNPALSAVVFLANSALVLGIAWPIAVRATKSPGE